MKSPEVKRYTDPQLMRTSAAGPVMSARPTPTLYPAETRLSIKEAMRMMRRRRGETEQGRFMLSSLTATSKTLPNTATNSETPGRKDKILFFDPS